MRRWGWLGLLLHCGGGITLELHLQAAAAVQSYDTWVLQGASCATIGTSPIAGLDDLTIVAYASSSNADVTITLQRGASYVVVIDGFSAADSLGSPSLRGCSDNVVVAKNASHATVNVTLVPITAP